MMSADPTLMPDDNMVRDILEEIDRQTDEEFSPVGKTLFSPEEELLDEDIPLNAEEATILVLSFLRRMDKKIVTPRKASLEGDIFTIDVKLKNASALVQINRITRDIVEYTIESEPREPLPLPIPPRRILLILGVVTSLIILTMLFTFVKMNEDIILRIMNSDYTLMGAGVLGIGIIAFLLYRRFIE